MSAKAVLAEIASVRKVPIHENIVQIFGSFLSLATRCARLILDVAGVCEQEKAPFILMEYAENDNLLSFLWQRPLTEKEQFQILLGVGRGLLALHHAGVIHNDIAARNIFLANGVVPKIGGMLEIKRKTAARSSSSWQTLGSPKQQLLGNFFDHDLSWTNLPLRTF